MQNDKGAVELLFGKKSTEHKHKHQNKKKVIKKKEPSSDQKQQSSKDKLLEKYAKVQEILGERKIKKKKRIKRKSKG